MKDPICQRQLSDNKDTFISLVIPIFNEVGNIRSFIQSLRAILRAQSYHYEIIVIDDGSYDTSIEKLLQLSDEDFIKIIKFSRNFGKEVALTAGLEHCRGDAAILMDADFQHPLDLIPKFIEEWKKGYDMVYGVRLNRDTESPLKRHLADLFYWLMGKMTKINIPRDAGDFRLLDRKVIDSLNSFQERVRFMKGLYAWVGFSQIGISYEVQERVAGKSSWNLIKLTELAINGITSFSDIPLRIWSFVGFIISLISLIYAVFIIGDTLVNGSDLPGFPTLAAAIMFFGGIQLLSIGILGEYIARIFTEVKQRPNYIIEYKKGFE